MVEYRVPSASPSLASEPRSSPREIPPPKSPSTPPAGCVTGTEPAHSTFFPSKFIPSSPRAPVLHEPTPLDPPGDKHPLSAGAFLDFFAPTRARDLFSIPGSFPFLPPKSPPCLPSPRKTAPLTIPPRPLIRPRPLLPPGTSRPVLKLITNFIEISSQSSSSGESEEEMADIAIAVEEELVDETPEAPVTSDQSGFSTVEKYFNELPDADDEPPVRKAALLRVPRTPSPKYQQDDGADLPDYESPSSDDFGPPPPGPPPGPPSPDPGPPSSSHRSSSGSPPSACEPPSSSHGSSSASHESSSSSELSLPAPDYEASLAAVWDREYATDVLPDGSISRLHPTDEAISRDLGWYSLEELLNMNWRSATRGIHWNMPEELIWRTLLTLLKDTALLHSGATEFNMGEHNGPIDWQPIQHNSINPNNVWYEKVDPENGGPFGRCVLGRVKRCLVLHNGPDLIEPDRLREEFSELRADHDARGYEAPELEYFDENNQARGTASDIWSIGAVILAMMTGANVRTFAQHLTEDACSRDTTLSQDLKVVLCHLSQDPLAHVGEAGLDFSTALPERFNGSLNTLVAMMLQRVPQQRPVAAEVIYWVQEAYDELPNERKTMGRRLDWAMWGLRMARQERHYYK